MYFPVELSTVYLEKAKIFQLKNEDIVEQFIRGSGKGGQKINKTSSCVLLRHLPSGVEVRCQKYREQSKNRLSAYKLLIDKLEQLIKGKASAREKKIFKLKKQKKKRSKRAQRKILKAKKQRSEVKLLRKKIY